MLDWLHIATAGTWSIIWHFGLAGILIAGCVLAGIYLAPTLKAKLTWFGLAGAVAIFSVAVAIGVSLGEKRVRAEWDASLVVEATQGEQAGSDAVRTIGPMSADRSVFRSDPWNRHARPKSIEHRGPVRWLERYRIRRGR